MDANEQAFQQMQAQLAADLAGGNGPEAQVQAILDEVDGMLASSIGALSIQGGEDIQSTRDGDTFTLFTAPPIDTSQPET